MSMNGFWGGRHERCYTECSILLTVEPPLIHATGNMKLLRRGFMSQESGKWSTALSLL